MSDLEAIFHVKKDGVQYDAHAYTTLDECPEPNLKVTYKGQQGYVKLEAKGEGDVPCYVKTKAGNTYQVKKEAVPTGGYDLQYNMSYTLTVPSSIKVIEVQINDEEGSTYTTYVGVTPNTKHTLLYKNYGKFPRNKYQLYCTSHNALQWIQGFSAYKQPKLRWSPEINKQTPIITDY